MSEPLLRGVRELSKQLDALTFKGRKEVLRKTTRESMKIVVLTAKELIPENDREYLRKTYKGRKVAPGFAKRSIHMRVWVNRSGTFYKASVGVSREAYYAVQYVERGTSKMKKHQWLAPALRSQSFWVLDKIRRGLKVNMEAAVRKGK